jgi:hypothetical protein
MGCHLVRVPRNGGVRRVGQGYIHFTHRQAHQVRISLLLAGQDFYQPFTQPQRCISSCLLFYQYVQKLMQQNRPGSSVVLTDCWRLQKHCIATGCG